MQGLGSSKRCWSACCRRLNTNRVSGAVLLWVLLIPACNELWQPEQVVCGATEDEHPIHLRESAHLYLGEWAGLLQPAEGLFDQPTTAEADRVAGVPGGSSIEVRAAPLSFF